MDPPSGRVPEQGLDWFLVATEVCGGGTPDLGLFLEVSVYIRGFGVENKSGGVSGLSMRQGGTPRGWARPPPSWAARDSSDPTLWPKSSLDITKLLLTWLCVLRAHVAIGWY